MNVRIETIPHDHQRYPTVGDWYLETETHCNDCSHKWFVPAESPATQCPHCGAPAKAIKATVLWCVIKVSDLGNFKENLLIAVHELVEVVKCKSDGVSQEAVDKFDIAYEKNRKEGDLSEPGDDPRAPYYEQHQAAMAVERLCAVLWGVDWETYAKRVEEMP